MVKVSEYHFAEMVNTNGTVGKHYDRKIYLEIIL